MLLRNLFEDLERTGQGKSAVVGWGRGMGHKGHMFLASSVITQANETNSDPYFVVSRTVGKDDPITPDEKLAIYKKVFPQSGHIFQTATEEMPDLTRVLSKLQGMGYTDVTVVVGADQVKALAYVKNYNGKPDKSGNIPFSFNTLNVISRQETSDPSRDQAGPRATPMRAVLMDPAKSEEEKFAVWRDAMNPELSDDEVRDLMNKAGGRMAALSAPKPKKAKAVAEAGDPFRGTAGAFNRGDDERHDIDRAREQQLAQYEQSGKFWLKYKDSQKHVNDTEYIGKAAARAAFHALLQKHPELKGNLVMTAWGPGEQQGVNELDVSKTLKFATKAHQGQQYGDKPYITHPRSVAATGKKFFGAAFTPDAIKVALLHDVVEDTPYKLNQLAKMGYSPEIVQAVQLLTKNKALSYADNIKAIIASGNKLAMMVKYADNYQNFTGDKSSWDPARAAHSQKKYLASLDMLGDKLGIKQHLNQPEEPGVAEGSDDVKRLQIDLWNLYKDVTGYRPRPGTVDWTQEQWNDPEFLKGEIDKLSRQSVAEGIICTHCEADPCICDDSHGFVGEERTSAAVRMQRAADRQRAKSDASLRRTPSSIPKKEEPKKDAKTEGSKNYKNPSWVSLGEGLSIADKISIFESYYANGAVLESKENTIKYFNGLLKYSVDPEKNKKYIVTPLMLIQNKVHTLNTELLKLTFLSSDGTNITFKKNDGTTVKFPKDFKGEQGITHTFVFDNIKSYNNFRSEVALKFNLNLPDAGTKQTVDDMEESLRDAKDNPYPVGTKKKADKTVPNCVPVSEEVENIMDALINKIIVNEAIQDNKR